jgi:two-component system response regulator AtoC
MAIHKVLVVDDEPLLRKYVAEILNRRGYEVQVAEGGKRALEILDQDQFDLVITDMKMSDYSGLDVLKKTKATCPETIVIVITAYGSVENVVQAMQMGAYNYVLKPFDVDTLETAIDKASELSQIKKENTYLRERVAQGNGRARISHSLIAESPSMKLLMTQIESIAASRANVFIAGESGTGKEVIAHALHRLSPRSQKPFIRVNCAAVPESLIESEFFGHEKGAFTGADTKNEGRFELADSGTLLLDEITEIPFNLQSKLLRVIQEQEFERLGGKKTIKVDVRLISTSNRDLKEAMALKEFREDLYYRLNVIPVYVPPLRERLEDILALSHYYLEKLCVENHKAKMELSKSAEKKLLEYHWPGNTRELINVMERAVVLIKSSTIDVDDLMIEKIPLIKEAPLLTLKEMENRTILQALRTIGNQKDDVAKALGITSKNLEKKLTEHSLHIN